MLTCLCFFAMPLTQNDAGPCIQEKSSIHAKASFRLRQAFFVKRYSNTAELLECPHFTNLRVLCMHVYYARCRLEQYFKS